MVLDEATSSIDAKTENKMMLLISRELKNSTVVAVLHRLGNLRFFNKVLVLDEGKAIILGTPDEVIANQDEVVRRLLVHHTD